MHESEGTIEAAADNPKALCASLGHASRVFQQGSMEELFRLSNLQSERLKVSREEDDPDLDDSAALVATPPSHTPCSASFIADVWATPSRYICSLVTALPEHQRLSKEQMFFVLTFVAACDDI